MARILKRPMFSRGGSTNKNNGIMDGLVDRTELSVGSSPFTEERTSADVKAMMDAMNKYSPVSKTKLPIGKLGSDLMRGLGFRESAANAYDTFSAADAQREAALAKRKQAAVTSSLGQQLKEANTIPKDTRTSAVKNAMALGLIPGTEAFSKYVQAATVKGGGLNIDFNPDGTIKSIAEGNQGDTKTINAARDLKIGTFKMNNAANNLFKNLEGAKTGPVGAFVQALDSTGAQLKQAANSFGFTTTGENKTFDDTGSGVIDKYIEKNFGSFVGNDAVQLGKIKSASINLAYLMARIDEPGGRFTDRDIALKMEELGIGANPQRTIAIMQNAIKLRNDNAAYEYEELTGKPLDFSKMNVFGSTPIPKDKTNQRNMDKVFNPLGVPEDQLTPIK